MIDSEDYDQRSNGSGLLTQEEPISENEAKEQVSFSFPSQTTTIDFAASSADESKTPPQPRYDPLTQAAEDDEASSEKNQIKPNLMQDSIKSENGIQTKSISNFGNKAEDESSNESDHIEHGTVRNPPPTTLEERRRINVERNVQRWKNLEKDLLPMKPKSRPKIKKKITPTRKRKGMQFSPMHNKDQYDSKEENFDSIQFIEATIDQYPHRSTQIRALHSLFEAFLCNFDQPKNHHNSMQCTPPVTFLTGPPYTGKTCILLDIIRKYRKHRNFGWAYINCATLGSGKDSESMTYNTLCDLLQNALNQIQKSLVDEEELGESAIKQPNQYNDSHEKDALLEEAPMDGMKGSQSRNQQESNDEISKGTINSFDKDAMRKSMNQGALPLAFGRYLQGVTYRSNSAIILVLDRAERLLSLTSKVSNANQFFSQLLLIPKYMRLNLWILPISTRSLLSSIGVNNSQGSIQECVQPINIHFNAYRGKDVFKEILRTSKMKHSIIGYNPPLPNTIIDYIYDAMLDSLILSVQDSTRDLGEIKRLAHMLWPYYIKPIEKKQINNVDGEIDISEKQKLKHDLDKEARPWIQKLLTYCLFQRGNSLQNRIPLSTKQNNWTDPPSYEVNKNSFKMDHPYYLKTLPVIPQFILVAGYLCQHNQSHTDLTLFTNKAKGRRKKSKKSSMVSTNGSIYEDLLSSATFSTNPFRANTSFPLERLLSIFCSIYGQYGDLKSDNNLSHQSSSSASSMQGSTVFFRSLTLLSNLGLLRVMDPPASSSFGGKEKGSSSAKFTTSQIQGEASKSKQATKGTKGTFSLTYDDHYGQASKSLTDRKSVV